MRESSDRGTVEPIEPTKVLDVWIGSRSAEVIYMGSNIMFCFLFSAMPLRVDVQK